MGELPLYVPFTHSFVIYSSGIKLDLSVSINKCPKKHTAKNQVKLLHGKCASYIAHLIAYFISEPLSKLFNISRELKKSASSSYYVALKPVKSGGFHLIIQTKWQLSWIMLCKFGAMNSQSYLIRWIAVIYNWKQFTICIYIFYRMNSISLIVYEHISRWHTCILHTSCLFSVKVVIKN